MISIFGVLQDIPTRGPRCPRNILQKKSIFRLLFSVLNKMQDEEVTMTVSLKAVIVY